MLRKYLTIMFAVMLVATVMFGCGSSNNTSPDPVSPDPVSPDQNDKVSFKVGMVTDAGTIDDKSFNQGTWEGLQEATNELGLESRYLRPSGETEASYLQEIGNLYDAGFRVIVTPGFKFETAIFSAQNRYKDAKFVLIDGSPHAGDWAPVVGENTVSIFFAEHESGFLAGLATALQLQEGDVGFIGGMEIPPVQKFNWGFQQGVQYANDNFNTSITMKSENIVYQGTFDNVAAGQQIAAQMFDRDVKAIFAAAGSVGIGSINEAKARMARGDEAWIIGVDVNQYEEGIYAGGNSAILTSAMKQIDQATYDMIIAEYNGEFPGGQTLVFDAKNDGVGIPDENPNLSAEVQASVAEAFAKLQSGDIVVSAEQGDLIK